MDHQECRHLAGEQAGYVSGREAFSGCRLGGGSRRSEWGWQSRFGGSRQPNRPSANGESITQSRERTLRPTANCGFLSCPLSLGGYEWRQSVGHRHFEHRRYGERLLGQWRWQLSVGYHDYYIGFWSHGDSRFQWGWKTRFSLN